MTINELNQLEFTSQHEHQMKKLHDETVTTCQQYIGDLDRDTFKNVFNVNNNIYTVRCPILLYHILTNEIGFDPEMIIETGEKETVTNLKLTMNMIDVFRKRLNLSMEELKVTTIEKNCVVYKEEKNDWTLLLLGHGLFNDTQAAYAATMSPTSLGTGTIPSIGSFLRIKEKLADAITNEKLKELFLQSTEFDAEHHMLTCTPKIKSDKELKNIKELFDIISNVKL